MKYRSPLLPLVLVPGLLMVSVSPACATSEPVNEPPASCTLVIHATGFRTDQGAAGAAVFDSPKGWPEDDKKAVAAEEFPISGLKSKASFQLPPGKYAVVVIGDVNKNERLDRNFFGIPKEGFGFSNNPHVGLSAPSFEKSSFEVTCPATEIEVRLIFK